jgi:hypothetical protein
MDLFKQFKAACKAGNARHATPESLRFDARVAFLDGRTKRAKELNRKADQLERAARKGAK